MSKKKKKKKRKEKEKKKEKKKRIFKYITYIPHQFPQTNIDAKLSPLEPETIFAIKTRNYPIFIYSLYFFYLALYSDYIFFF